MGVAAQTFGPQFMPAYPIRFSIFDVYLLIVVLAASEIGTSGGKIRVFSHSIIFLYVSVGLSLQNGGYPISISNIITPKDHQSHVDVYPV